MGQICSQAPGLEEHFTAALNIYSRVRMLRPSILHQGNGNRGNLILTIQPILAKASTAQSRGKHMQSLAAETPISLCTCTIA